MTGATVREAVNNPQVQFDAVAALHERYQYPVALSAMDLSAEAEPFGCALHVSDNEIPSVTGPLVTSLEQARNLPGPQPGDWRTAVYLETVRRLKKLPSGPLVLGGCIGPFSLASRLVGVSDALELTLAEPDLTIAAAVEDGHFALVLHNCAARLLHLSAILETGLTSFHFGVPIDLPAAFSKVSSDVVLCGNLDPAGVFCQRGPEEVTARAADLLAHTATHRNFVISSGCDVPTCAPLFSLDPFYAAVKGR